MCVLRSGLQGTVLATWHGNINVKRSFLSMESVETKKFVGLPTIVCTETNIVQTWCDNSASCKCLIFLFEETQKDSDTIDSSWISIHAYIIFEHCVGASRFIDCQVSDRLESVRAEHILIVSWRNQTGNKKQCLQGLVCVCGHACYSHRSMQRNRPDFVFLEGRCVWMCVCLELWESSMLIGSTHTALDIGPQLQN